MNIFAVAVESGQIAQETSLIFILLISYWLIAGVFGSIHIIFSNFNWKQDIFMHLVCGPLCPIIVYSYMLYSYVIYKLGDEDWRKWNS